MKKALIICIIIFVVSVVAFGVSVAATGLREGNFAVAIGLDKVLDKDFDIDTDLGERATKHFDFANSVNDIELDIASSTTLVTVGDVDKITVDYTSDNRHNVNARVDGDKLVVEESTNFVVTFINWDLGNSDADLVITLPRKEYDDVTINAASGEVEIKELVSKNFDANSASGNMNYNIFAEDIKISTLSGNVQLNNCTDRKAKKLKLTSTSGDHSVSGFMTEKFAFESTSGCITADGISGEGEVDITSGEIELAYALWDNELDINAVSGSIDVTLPFDSGVMVELSAASGGVDVLLGGKTEITVDGETGMASGATETHLSGDCETGIIGGSNAHKVEINLMSGDVDIHN